ncbi:MAG: tetratricopeptide repeat protein [Verrucomicrobiota bacterium]
MMFGFRSYRSSVLLFLLLASFAAVPAFAQDYSSMGISPLVRIAGMLLERGEYSEAIPALEELIVRTEELTTADGRETLQNARFQLGRALFQIGKSAAGMKVIEEYLAEEPRDNERLALRLMAQGHLDAQDWEKVAEIAGRLLDIPKLGKDDLLNANLLYGQARFRQEMWADCIKPLGYVVKNTKNEKIRQSSQIMTVRALVEAGQWNNLFGLVRSIYRTDAKYDITLNITLMLAGKTLFDDAGEKEAEEAKDDYLNALFLYRMVLPRGELIGFADKRMAGLSADLAKKTKAGAKGVEELQEEIDGIKASLATLKELPPYEDEVTFRIGQIYAEVKRYWEGYVLFDSLYERDRNSDIGEASILQSVLVLYDVGETDRAEERIMRYLDEKPDGQYARTLLLKMMRYNLLNGNLDKVAQLQECIEKISDSTDSDEQMMEADLYYMQAFGFFQSKDFKLAGEQFGVIIDGYPASSSWLDSIYFRGMTYMMQGDYANAMLDFMSYQESGEDGDHYGAAMFREGVCLYGMEQTVESEEVLSKFIEEHPEHELVSEAYSMRGDIEAAKDGNDDPETEIDEYDPHTLDRALADYRKAIDKYYSPLEERDKKTINSQAAYAAFQSAKVYKLEFKWQEIIDLMNYYMNLLGEKADVAQAVFWIGQSQIELGQVDEAVAAYLDAIERFGNEPEQAGIDKIVLELVKIANQHLSEEACQALTVKIGLKLKSVEEAAVVLRLRLRVAKAHLEGGEAASALGAELLAGRQELAATSPISLALMCDAAVAAGDSEQMGRLYDYFLANFEESDELWHAHRAKTFQLLGKEDYLGVLKTIDQAQGMFGAEAYMGWAQISKADTLYKLGEYADAEEAYNMIMSVPDWRGGLYAEAHCGMARCHLAQKDFEKAHAYFQRTYMLFKVYDDGKWAADGYLGAADCLVRLGRPADAVNTLDTMLEDPHVNTLPQADTAREMKKKHGDA